MTQTETTTSHPESETTDGVERPKRGRTDLSLVQLFAGALAAMTAAVIGSRLGVSGTVFGAAIGSLVAGVTGSLYTASLQRGRQVIAKAPLAVKAAPILATRARPTASRTTPAAIPPGAPSQAAPTGEVPTGAKPRRRTWTRALAVAAAVFVLAGLGITALELATGQSLSGREGTTISQVGEGDGAPAPQSPQDRPAEVPTTEEIPTEVPSDSPSVPAETPSQTPSEQPSEEPSETPTEDPAEPLRENPTSDPSAPPTDDVSE